MVVDLRPKDFVEQWSNSTRNKIHKASRENLIIDRGRHLLPAILELFAFTAVRKGLKGYTADHFASFPNLECSIISNNTTALCGHVWLNDPEEKEDCCMSMPRMCRKGI